MTGTGPPTPHPHIDLDAMFEPAPGSAFRPSQCIACGGLVSVENRDRHAAYHIGIDRELGALRYEVLSLRDGTP